MKPFVLLWLFGLCLRMTVLAVPPVIPMIHDSLALSQAQVGALASLPVLLVSFAAVPGSILIARFGAFRVLLAGTVSSRRWDRPCAAPRRMRRSSSRRPSRWASASRSCSRHCRRSCASGCRGASRSGRRCTATAC
jgi:hypothetical protein